MKDKTLTLDQRLKRLENEVFGDEKQNRVKPTAHVGNFDGPSGGVRQLISQNFFKTERGLADVKAALRKNGYLGYVDAYSRIVGQAAPTIAEDAAAVIATEGGRAARFRLRR